MPSANAGSDDIHNKLIGLRPVHHTAPEAVGAYLYVCEEYFRSGTKSAISSPMRDLLHRLNKIDTITNLTLSDIDAKPYVFASGEINIL